jgi:hypothetical protein
VELIIDINEEYKILTLVAEEQYGKSNDAVA